MTNPPVLHLPQATGRFILYSDTSKTHTGSSLWQRQDGKPRLLGCMLVRPYQNLVQITVPLN